ncbi:MAG: hypothetical protein PHW82_13910 [Bacteroidales bacterium]|nr:hypothetical protein [Bacteroidales bacterium]
MKLESLNCEKFEKIEKNELGMLVGGAVPGWNSSANGSAVDANGVTHTWSSDYYQTECRGTILTRNIINGGDISEVEMLQRLEKIR